MLAIDTNIVIRYLTADHTEQSAWARALIASKDVFVCVTVLLESEWVLRSAYGFDAAAIAKALRGFAGLPHIKIEDENLAAKALDWMEAGVDFADALHLVRAGGCEAFISFDRSLAKAASRCGGIAVRTP
jgi:predicted nucleic-acid-binding protein